MATITITKEQMIRDINSDLCGTLEAWTCSFEYSFDPKPIKLFTRWWDHPDMGDHVKVTETGQCHLGFPGELYNHGWHYHDSPVCHPWLQEQEDKYPGFIEKVWLNIKGI
jgi:hypothetical protein